ncbi:hypothetical protein CUMW_248630 [Citrus unshiu]|uniref:Uncharacterized protein n=1 Tax=Citrus unshiu TaxID=55188 RepID=A0A2H5QPA3_CITUN|nr:hypothetical protein CUMW_248630 [Citrus unshiu]
MRDVEYALTEGPWTVMGQYLIVQQWSPSFDVASNKIEKIMAWIRLAEMNIHFYNKNIIRHLGEIVGPMVKIDHKTIRSRSPIPTSSLNNGPNAMQGMLAQTGNLSANPNDVPTGENHCRELDRAQSFHSANGKEASVSDEDDSVVAESAMDIGAESVGLSQ